MRREGFQEALTLLLHLPFRLQEKLLVSEGKTMMMNMEKMRKICFSLPLDPVVRLQGTLLLGECAGSLQEVCGGRCWAFQGGEHQKGETHSHSLWRQAGEAEREETQLGLGWSGARGRNRLTMGGVEEEGGCLGLVKETAVARRKGSHLWHFLWLRAEA